MADDFITDLMLLSKNATKLARKLGEFEGTPDAFAAKVLKGIEVEGQAIIQGHITEALLLAKEYAIPEFEEPLRMAFAKPDILITKRAGIKIDAVKKVGSWAELGAGIKAARLALGITGRLSAKKASDFWRERIYRPAREGLQRPRVFKKLSKWSYYKGYKGRRTQSTFDYRTYGIKKYYETIRTRLRMWHGKAPYWLWIEHGNHSGEGGTSYPACGPTNFVARAEVSLNRLYEQKMFALIEQFTEAVGEEIKAFLQNPQGYEPGTYLADFEYLGTRFQISAGKQGEISVTKVS